MSSLRLMNCDELKKRLLKFREKNVKMVKLFLNKEAKVLTSAPCPFNCDAGNGCLFDLVIQVVPDNGEEEFGVRLADKKGIDWIRDWMDRQLGYLCLNCMNYVYGGGKSGIEQ